MIVQLVLAAVVLVLVAVLVWRYLSCPYKVGKNYFIRTVTFHHTGKLKKVYKSELVLENAAWIAVDGRFANAVAEGAYAEVEPYPDDRDVVIGRGSIVDAVVITHPLPRVQK